MEPKKKRIRRPGGGRKIEAASGKREPFTIRLSPAEQAKALANGPTVALGVRALIDAREPVQLDG